MEGDGKYIIFGDNEGLQKKTIWGRKSEGKLRERERGKREGEKDRYIET